MLKLTEGTSIDGEMQILVKGQEWTDLDSNVHD